MENDNGFGSVFDALSNLYSNDKPVAEIPAGQATSESAPKLIVALKDAAINLRTLHRHLSGGNWFTIHELIGDWYDEIDEHEDAMVENLMSIGVADQKVDCAKLLDIKDYSEQEALRLCKEMFEEIQALSVAARNELNIPTALSPIFDELEQFIEVEAKYKLARYFQEQK